MIERDFDVPFVADLALREKQIQQNYRPIMAVHKWFADALATNLSDLLRYQNMLCRYDTMALKSLDAFSVHGFPIGLIQCESNVLGVGGRTSAVGSGGWLNIVDKLYKAQSPRVESNYLN